MDKEILLKSWFKNKGEAKYRSELRTEIAGSWIQASLCLKILISDSEDDIDSEMALF